jgi:hypothetical protein
VKPKKSCHTWNAFRKATTDVWNAAKRPFVETYKFLRDPTAGLRRAYAKVVADVTALAHQVAIWLSIGFGAALAFCIALAMGLAAFLFRRRRTTSKQQTRPKQLRNAKPT